MVLYITQVPHRLAIEEAWMQLEESQSATPLPNSLRKRVMWANRIIRVVLVCAAKTRLFVRPTVIGCDNLPSSGALLVAPCHISVYDPVGLFVPIVKHRPDVTFLAMAELFDNPVLSRILQWFGIIPVARGTSAATKASRLGVDVLRAGGVVTAFIEGKISPTGELLPPKAGVAYMAFATRASVVPVAIVGTDQVKHVHSEWWRWGWRRRYVVIFGAPIKPPETLKATRLQRDALSAQIMDAIGILTKQAQDVLRVS